MEEGDRFIGTIVPDGPCATPWGSEAGGWVKIWLTAKLEPLEPKWRHPNGHDHDG